MTILLITVTVALFAKKTVFGATECYSCVNSTAVSKCSSVVSCKIGEICFADHITAASGPSISLGCMPEVSCSSIMPESSGNVSVGGSLIGRSTTVGDCSECCRQNRCNRQLCQSSLQQQQHCSDGGSLNCASVADFLDVCLDHSHALQTCRRFCGLCSYADGSWSSWLEWSSCDVTCGNGTQSRIRKCTEPSPSDGGKDCSGTSKQTQICFTGSCPVHGHWSTWSSWGSCSATCGIGLQRRDRSCSNPYPALNGNHCFGDSRDDKLCVESACPETNGGWSGWSVWTDCSATCDTGVQTRQRQCNNPVPSTGGQYCVGSPVDVVHCNIQHCPKIDGGWNAWAAWTPCTATCNSGLKTRQRHCANPRPSGGGQYCEGAPIDVVECNQNRCPRAKSSFTANKATWLSTSVLSFLNVLLNEGSNFNGSSGTFTCQHSGLYFFTASVVEHGNGENSVYCYIRRNDSDQVELRYWNARDSTNERTRYGVGAATGSATLHLTNGDRVYVWCGTETLQVYDSSFTGFLIAEDP